jgi:CubicO group peptidase (beta-lactamase class C family)
VRGAFCVKGAAVVRRLLLVVGLITVGTTGVVLVGGVSRGSLNVVSAGGARAMVSPVGVQGPPEQPSSVLAIAPPVPSYWPTAGWRTASSPESQGMDGKRLDAMLAEIRSAKLPLDSVTVVRHGRVVFDSSFGRFASGKLGEPYASGRLHELQSATKSVTSMLLAIALQQKAATGITVKTPVLRLAASIHSYHVPKHTDARKRAMTIEDLLTMQSGLAWRESGYDYTPGSGNDVMTMFTTKSWTNYVINRPMATHPGTAFVYNTGASHLVSGVISILTGRPAAALAAKRLFAPSAFATTSGLPLRRASTPEGSACSCSRATSPSSPSSTFTTDAGTAARSSPPPGSSSRRQTTSQTPSTSTATSGGSTAPTATRIWPACTGNSPSSTPGKISSP